jgi:DnaJ-class molecular chaperone
VNGEGFVCDLDYCVVCRGTGEVIWGNRAIDEPERCPECDGTGSNPYMEPEHGKPTRPEEEALDYDGD